MTNEQRERIKWCIEELRSASYEIGYLDGKSQACGLTKIGFDSAYIYASSMYDMLMAAIDKLE